MTTTMDSLRLPQDRGWAIASTAGGLVILLLVIIWSASKWDEYWQNRDWQVSAATVSRFTQAVRAYTGRYYETLLNSATTTTPVIVTPLMLKNTGFLESGFNETISSGQKLTASLVRNATNTDQLQGLIVSQGGVALPYMAVRDISVSVSAGLGAYLWDSNSIITGANASWTMPLSTFGVATSSGHIASLLTTDDLNTARQDTDRLYRFSVTGKPDLNRMHTSIDMGGNDLNNTRTVNAQTGQFSGAVNGQTGQFSGGVTAGGDIRSTDGTLVTRGNKGWTNETHQGGFYMSDNDWVRSVNDKNIYTGGQMRGGTLRADGNASVGGEIEMDAVRTAGTACPKNGSLAPDATGATLSCQSGVWKSGSLAAFSNVIAGECSPEVGQTKTCYLADISWFCTLSGVGGAGEEEFGYVERRTDGWFAVTERRDWPARYRWTCFK